MSISITKLNEIISKPADLMIIFRASIDDKITTKSVDNYVFIYNKLELIGINVFNYQTEFNNIKEGYHRFSNDNFNKILEKYPKYMIGSKNSNTIKIGLIKEIKKHPKNNKLNILIVKTSDGNLQIISNLSNLVIGNKYLFALNGSFLATGVIIDDLKIMGIESQGMICSYKSIGIGEEGEEGIIKITDKELNNEYEF